MEGRESGTNLLPSVELRDVESGGKVGVEPTSSLFLDHPPKPLLGGDDTEGGVQKISMQPTTDLVDPGPVSPPNLPLKEPIATEGNNLLLQERIQPAYETLSTRQKVGCFISLLTAMFLGSLDDSIIIVALNKIVEEFGKPELLAWVVSAYMLTSSATTALYGRFSDVYGRRHVYVFAISSFVIGSILSATCTGIWMLIVARGVQGIGAGGLRSLGMTVLGDIIAPAGRAKAMSGMSSIFVIAHILGPLIGGGFTDGPGWRWVFWINVPLGGIALILAILMMRYETKREKMPLDVLGAFLIASASICVVLFVCWGGQEGGYPWSSPVIISLIVVAVVLLILFMIQESRHPLPILNLRLFKQQNFTVIMITMFLLNAVMVGAFTFLPLYWQQLKGDSATIAGLKLLPLAGGFIFLATVAGAVVTKTKSSYGLLPLGSAMMTIGAGVLIGINPNSSYGYIGGAGLLFLGLGVGILFPVNATIVQNSVPQADMANALSSFTFFQTLGGALGVAILDAVLNVKVNQELMITDNYPIAFCWGLRYVYAICTVLSGATFVLSFLVKSVSIQGQTIAVEPVKDGSDDAANKT